MSATSTDPVAPYGRTGMVGPAVAGPHRPGWAAVTGGALVATAVTVMLLALGAGIGLGSVSTTEGGNPSPATFTALAAIWLIIVQWVSSFFGGYLAGRLRPSLTADAGVQARGEETTFRDTALGFVTWALSSLIIVAMVSGSASSLLGTAGKAAGGAASSAMQGATAGAASGGGGSGDPSGYLLNELFRPTTPNPSADTAAAKAEAGGILATTATGGISQPDHDYLVQMVAARTGLPPDQASQRVDDVIGKEKAAVEKARMAADAARKYAAEFSIYTFFSMLIGAFISCVAAAIGGRQRDAR